jgi:hypothetical protein
VRYLGLATVSRLGTLHAASVDLLVALGYTHVCHVVPVHEAGDVREVSGVTDVEVQWPQHQQRCPERRLQVTGRTAASTRRAVRVSRPDATPIISVEEHRPGCRGEWWTNDVLHTPITAEFIHAARVAYTVASGCARAMGETRDDMFSHRSTMPPPPSYVMVSDVPSQREAVSK